MAMMNYDFIKHNKDYPLIPEYLLVEQEIKV